MVSASNRVMQGIWKYIIAAFFLVGLVIAAFFFRDELNIGKYLPFLVIAAVLLHLLLFEKYRKAIIKKGDQEKQERQQKPKYPWDAD